MTLIRTFSSKKLLGIAFLILFLQFPILTIEQLTKERDTLRNSSMSSSETIFDPIIKVPFESLESNSKEPKEAFFIAENSLIEGYIDAKKIKKSLYSFVEYKTKLKLSGKFNLNIQPFPRTLLWDQAVMLVRFRSNENDIKFSELELNADGNISKYNQSQLSLGNSLNNLSYSNSFQNTFEIPINLQNSGSNVNYKTELELNGRQNLNFILSSRETELRISSNWKTPSFNGSVNPLTRKINDEGFSYSWMSNNYPRASFSPNLNDFQFEKTVNIDLFTEINHYRLIHRVIRYQLLFFAIIFLTLIIYELTTNISVHPIQYLLVGAALCTFYLILLSFSEHFGFQYAYLLAAFCSVTMIGSYSAAILGYWSRGITIAGLLSASYGLLYCLIHLQDNALMIGTVVITIILALIMYKTRKFDWYLLQGIK